MLFTKEEIEVLSNSMKQFEYCPIQILTPDLQKQITKSISALTNFTKQEFTLLAFAVDYARELSAGNTRTLDRLYRRLVTLAESGI